MATIFGGDTGLSYEDVQRKRKIADALLAQNMRGSQNVPQGLTSVARALAAKSIENKTGQAMEGLNAEADAIFNSIFGGGGGTFAGMGATGGMGPTSPAPVPGVRTSGEGEAVADDAMATLVKMGLTERGLPEHVADGFVMNARDESGLSTDINEIAPLVPGSRGGYGLMQWTGPRRVALEQAAAERGVAPSDLNLQLDTIVSELQGPEARAGQAILSTKDAPSAATAIVNDFLRPAPEHRARRAAAYGGQPSQGGGSPSVQAIAAAMANPVIQNDPGKMAILQSLLGQAMQANDPLRAMEMERAQLELEALRNPQADIDTQFVDGIGLMNMDTGETIRPDDRQSEATTGISDELMGQANTLRDDFRTEAASYSDVINGFSNIHNALATPGAVSDVQLAVSFTKVLDPGSVAREGEVSLVAASAGLGERLTAAINNAIQGRGVLTASQREQIYRLAQQKYDQAAGKMEGTVARFGEIARRQGIPIGDVVAEFKRMAPYEQEELLRLIAMFPDGDTEAGAPPPMSREDAVKLLGVE
jgi:hypothetical protein